MKSYTQINESHMFAGVWWQIIKQLKDKNVDGETMQFILHEVGMEEQMLSQLISTNPDKAISVLMEIDYLDNEEVEKSILEKMKEDPKFYNKIQEFLLQVDTEKYNL